MEPTGGLRRAFFLAGMHLILSLICVSLSPSFECRACDVDVKALLIANHAHGPDNWLTYNSFTIENMLEFNGIPYEFFDIYENVLDQSKLDQYDGVILEGFTMRWAASASERALIAANMESGNIVVLLGPVHGEYAVLNGTIYGAIDVSVDGLANCESNVILGEGASNVYDYDGEDGFVIAGGYEGKHVAIALKSLGEWTYGSAAYGAPRTYGFEFALERWMQNAFGVDARVTLPVISLRWDDTQTWLAPPSEDLMDFIDENKHRIRASGFLVTDASAYQSSDSTLQYYEQINSQWGSMSLHGKDHDPVGAEGENRDFARQYSDMNIAVAFLQEHFSRYKAIKASPMNSWNAATLHAMYLNGIYYHSANMWTSPEYKTLYRSLFDVEDEFERVKMFARGELCKLRYYPLIHTDETGTARIYSADWIVCFDPPYDPDNVIPLMKRYAIDWWIPILPGAHGSSTMASDPPGWMAVMSELMNLVDHDSYSWHRWVTSYDFAKNLQRFDEELAVNSITVSANTVTYDITAAEPIRFMTLKADRVGYKVAWVTINGAKHCYFGDNYVHLPEIDGNAVIVVNMTGLEDYLPHVTHVNPSAVIEHAGYASDRLELSLSGEFDVTAYIVGSNKVFGAGTTRVYGSDTSHLEIDVSSFTETEQVELALTPSSGSVEATIGTWDVCDTGYREWSERADGADISVEHRVGGLAACAPYVVLVDGCCVDQCTSDGCGEICFTRCEGCSTKHFEIVADSVVAGAGRGDGSRWGDEEITALFGKSHPNPFVPGTVIRYGLPRVSQAALRIYSVDGCLVRTLADGPHPAGRHGAGWDGLDGRGEPVSSGIYFCQIETPTGAATCKLVLAR